MFTPGEFDGFFKTLGCIIIVGIIAVVTVAILAGLGIGYLVWG